jgi:hypothetical protein
MGWISSLKAGAPVGNQFEEFNVTTAVNVTADPSVPLTLLTNTSGGQREITLLNPPQELVGAIKRFVAMSGNTAAWKIVVSNEIADGDKEDQFINDVGGVLTYVWTGASEGWAICEQASDGADITIS